MPAGVGRVIRMKYRNLVLVLMLQALTAACAGLPSHREPAPPSPPEEPARVSAPPPQVVVTRDPELEQKLARTELQLLEKEAQLSELQARLDDARQEVVRAMAKQQSLASRAEAASGMAEAEIALQSLRASAGAQGVPDVSSPDQAVQCGIRQAELRRRAVPRQPGKRRRIRGAWTICERGSRTAAGRRKGVCQRASAADDEARQRSGRAWRQLQDPVHATGRCGPYRILPCPGVGADCRRIGSGRLDQPEPHRPAAIAGTAACATATRSRPARFAS